MSTILILNINFCCNLNAAARLRPAKDDVPKFKCEFTFWGPKVFSVVVNHLITRCGSFDLLL